MPHPNFATGEPCSCTFDWTRFKPRVAKTAGKLHDFPSGPVEPGLRYGRLLVDSYSHKKRNGKYFLCKCDCGNEKVILASSLKNGRTQSCGCLRREAASAQMTTHGHSKNREQSPTYQSWHAMRQRCTDPNHVKYASYGGAGVKCCDRWTSFDHFLTDMGERPEGKTLDRIDPYGNYEPSNCRWATSLEQRHNRRDTKERTASKLRDFLMNPKSRPDLQTPKAQRFLEMLERRFHNEKTDALMPWLAREWKRGRLTDPWLEDALQDHSTVKALPDELKAALRQHHEGQPVTYPDTDVPELYDAIAKSQYPRSLFYNPPRGRVAPFDGGAPLHQENVNHWADFLQSNHPLRREMGDIMKQDITSFAQRIHDWDEAMAQEAHQRGLQGGEVVHTTPDNWTIRKLTTPEELKAEGEAMGHCVGGYHSAVQNGHSLIYSLRDPNNSPHVTTEIEPRYFGNGNNPGKLHRDNLTLEEPFSPEELANGYGPIPHQGQVIQSQGKGNREPLDEYKARMADWFRNFPPEQRPVPYDDDETSLMDDQGYSHEELDHPDLIPEYERQYGSLVPSTEPTEDEYGLLHSPAQIPADYESLLSNISFHDHGPWATHNRDHVNDIYRLARARGEIPQLAHFAEGYSDTQQSNFDDWMEQNWQMAPRYVDFDDPHGWEDEEGEEVGEGEGRPFWTPTGQDTGYGTSTDRYYDPEEAEKAYEEAYGQWQSEHPGMSAASQIYDLLNPHFGAHPETGKSGYWNTPPPSQQLAFSKMAHPLYTRWVFSPATGQVEIADNSGDPLDVSYHTDLAREINEPNLTHGYAYRIGNGWRLLDWDSKPVEDPFVVASVMRALQGSQTPQEASWADVGGDDWSRLHHALPT